MGESSLRDDGPLAEGAEAQAAKLRVGNGTCEDATDALSAATESCCCGAPKVGERCGHVICLKAHCERHPSDMVLRSTGEDGTIRAADAAREKAAAAGGEKSPKELWIPPVGAPSDVEFAQVAALCKLYYL